jgi:hypothetical protein
MQGRSADTKRTAPVQPEVWLDRTEFQDLIHPQAAKAVETSQSAGAGTKSPDTRLLASRSSQVPLVPQLTKAEFGHPVAVDTDPQAVIALDPAQPGLAATIADPAATNTATANIGSDTPVPATVAAGRSAGSDIPKPA